MKKIISGMLITMLVLALSPLASAASAPALLYDFEGYAAGKTMEELGIGKVDSEYKPEFAGIVATSFAAGGSGNAMQVIAGEWLMGDDNHVIELDIPAGMQDWSGYEWLGFYVNVTEAFSGVLGLQIHITDTDGKTWGWASDVIGGYGDFRWNDGWKFQIQNTNWGGIGLSSWQEGGYVGLKLDSSLFPNGWGEGKDALDFSGIKTIRIRIGTASGGREGDRYYFDNFFLCNTLEIDPDSAIALVDGTNINDLFFAASSGNSGESGGAASGGDGGETSTGGGSASGGSGGSAKTGDPSIIGFALLGMASTAGALSLSRKRNKK